MSERTDQKKAELLLSAAFAPLGLFWTCDVGSGVPYSSIRALPKRLKAAYAWGGLAAVLSTIATLPVVSYGIEGGNDVQGSLEGRWIGVEMKTATGRQRAAQKVFQRNIERAGGVYVMPRSAEDAVEAVWNAVAPTPQERAALAARVAAARAAMKKGAA